MTIALAMITTNTVAVMVAVLSKAMISSVSDSFWYIYKLTYPIFSMLFAWKIQMFLSGLGWFDFFHVGFFQHAYYRQGYCSAEYSAQQSPSTPHSCRKLKWLVEDEDSRYDSCSVRGHGGCQHSDAHVVEFCFQFMVVCRQLCRRVVVAAKLRTGNGPPANKTM